mgnify:FL=1
MVKVSIGVPIYNVAEYLRQCLDSIIEQTFTDFEVIMVDDGSNDDSFNICQEYAAKDSRFKLVHQKNKGLAGARNTCLKHMKGEYVTWVDSDDIIEPNYLEKLVTTVLETQADIVQCMFYGIKGDQKAYYVFPKLTDRVKKLELSRDELIWNTWTDKYYITVMWANLVNRRLYQGLYFSQGILYEDTGNKFKLYFRANKMVIISDTLYGYRQRENSIMGKTKNEIDNFRKNYICNLEKYTYYLNLVNMDSNRTNNIYLGIMEFWKGNARFDDQKQQEDWDSFWNKKIKRARRLLDMSKE